MGPRAVLDTVVKGKILSPRRESNPRTPTVQPIAQLGYHGSFGIVTAKTKCMAHISIVVSRTVETRVPTAFK